MVGLSGAMISNCENIWWITRNNGINLYILKNDYN